MNAYSLRQFVVIFEITQVDIDCQCYFYIIYSHSKIIEIISMNPYKKTA